jgi:tRNA-specific 2-thiouridylase
MNVFVGLSGGVDSAVSAALLKERGHDVTGVFIKIWQPEFIECTWREDRLDAMRVAACLGIPFREVDFSTEYKKEVVDTMVADYARGITPNPDVVCNRTIKFGHFARWARAEGADYVATGHYARIIHNDLRCRYALCRGKDANKDQSYFLYTLTQDELARTFFPIGEFTKSGVRALAKKFGLPNAEKPDSQGICFLGDVSMEDFLGRFLPLERGRVVDTEGARVGEHHGAALYTVGQRHGFTTNKSQMHYVVAVDVATNTVIVSTDRNDAARAEIELEGAHWINPQTLPLEVEAQARYRETPVKVRIERRKEGARVIFSKPHIAAPGQSLVLYERDRCVGGGTISQ